jgi:hypothetical protein
MNKGSETSYGKDRLIDWILKKSDYLNAQWEYLMQAEQAGCNPDGSYKQSNRIQSIANKARQAILKNKNELSNLNLSGSLYQVKIECNNFLDKWDFFFYYMSKYAKSRDLVDLETATKSYSAVDLILSKICSLLGCKSQKISDTQTPSLTIQQATFSSVREKQIIRTKEVIVKIKCPSCKRFYDENLNVCPFCGTKS